MRLVTKVVDFWRNGLKKSFFSVDVMNSKTTSKFQAVVQKVSSSSRFVVSSEIVMDDSVDNRV